jgi:TolB-like protein
LADIFLSYNRDDLPTARRFAEAFEREGFSVWWDQTLDPGEHYDDVTEKALKEARAVVVLWSKKSVDSRWVRAEATLADRNKTLVPVMIESCDRPIMFELTHTADLSLWNGDRNDQAWKSYLAVVRRFVSKDAPGAPSPSTAQPIARPQEKFGTGALAGVALLLVVGIWAWVAHHSHGLETAPTVAGAATPTAAKQVTLAVLPFVNLSSDKEQEYFSDGLTEEILNQLAQVKDLRVTARTSSFSFKGKNEDVRVIGEKLGVANLLEGSIRKDGSQLRITAQLVSGKDGAHLWSQTYDREMSGVFAVQEQVAKDVAQALSIRLDVGDMSRAQGGTTNIEAYDKYLHARTFVHQLGPRELQQALQLYRQAVSLDADFARAWSGLYAALGYSLVWTPETSDSSLKEMATASARVEALAPNAWWTQTMRANQFTLQRKWSVAEAAVNAAQSLAPASEIDAIRARVDFLTFVGRVKEAVEYQERVRQMDPLSLSTSGFLQGAYDFVGRSAEAQAEYMRSKDFAGDHAIWDWWALQRLWRQKGVSQAEVQAQFQTLLKHESLPMTLNRDIASNLGNDDAVRAAIRRAFKDPANQDATRMSVVAQYADYFGEPEVAVLATRRALVEFNGSIFSILWRPGGESLRSDPRFKDILRDLKLVDYFRASGNWGDFCKPVGTDDFECH